MRSKIQDMTDEQVVAAAASLDQAQGFSGTSPTSEYTDAEKAEILKRLAAIEKARGG